VSLNAVITAVAGRASGLVAGNPVLSGALIAKEAPQPIAPLYWQVSAFPDEDRRHIDDQAVAF
jgi:hypothetical protein